MPGIAIPSGDLWSFNAALLEAAEGQLRLKDQRLLNERFDGALDGSEIGTITAASGTITIEDDGIPAAHSVHTRPGAGDYAALFIKDTFDETNPFRLSLMVRSPEFAGSNPIFWFSGYSADPTANDIGTFQIWGTLFSATKTQIAYRTSGGVAQYWNGSAWQAAPTGHTLPDYSWYEMILSTDGTSWQIEWVGEDGATLFTTTPITWANTQALGGGESAYAVLGMIQAGSTPAVYNLASIERWSEAVGLNFSTASPAATSPWFAIDQNTLDAVTAILLQLILEGTATIKFQWALNNGAFNGSWLTPAQLLAALNGLTITDHTNSMRLMSQHNSNGTDQAAMLLPQTKAEASGVTAACDYPIEANVRLGVDYDSGNLTGSAAIPGASDVRDGVSTDDTVGTAAIPGANDVRLAVPTDDTVGNYVPAEEGNHALGDSYGSFGSEFTGTKALTPYKLPVEVILEDEEILVFEGCE